MVEKQCEICNQAFRVYNYRKDDAKYCSKICSGESKKKNRLKCSYCGEITNKTKTKNRSKAYCGRECSSKSNRTGLTKKCLTCEIDFYVPLYRKDTSKYCSTACESEYRRAYSNCPICEKQFFSRNKNTYCSSECYKASIEIKRESQYITLICSTCEEEYTARSYRVGESKYCSHKCYTDSKKTGHKKNCYCDQCHVHFYKNSTVQRQAKYNFCSRGCMSKYYIDNKLFSGEKNGNWGGGKINYYGETWRKQRNLARERDNYTCQDCGVKECDYGIELSVHHLIPFVIFNDSVKANDLSNLKTVCEPCHRKIHSGDLHPSKFKSTFKDFIKD